MNKRYMLLPLLICSSAIFAEKLEDFEVEDSQKTKNYSFHSLNPHSLVIEIEALFVRPTIDGLEFASVFSTPSSSHLAEVSKDIKDINFDFEGGVDARIGFKNLVSGAELLLGYTYMNSFSKREISTSSPVIQPLKLGMASDCVLPAAKNREFAQNARGIWDFNQSKIYLQWAHYYSLSPKTMMRPQLGLTMLFSSMVADFSYNDIFFTTETLFPTFVPYGSREVSYKRNFFGIGPHVALRSSWNFWRSMSLEGGIFGALYVGDEKRERVAGGNVPDVPAPNALDATYFKVETKLKQETFLFPELDMHIGISWEACMKEARKANVFIGYASYFFWKQSVISENDNLQVKGARISGRFEF